MTDNPLEYAGPMPCDWVRTGVVMDKKGRVFDLRVEGPAGVEATAGWGWAVENLFAGCPSPARTNVPPGLRCVWRRRTAIQTWGD